MVVSLSEEQEYLLELLARVEIKASANKAVEEDLIAAEHAETLEAELDESELASSSDVHRGDSGERDGPLSVSYGLPDEHGLHVRYAALFYGEQPAAGPSAYQLQDEEAEDVAEDVPAEEIMTVEEGENLVQEAQYAVLTTGNTLDMDPEELRRLDLQIKIDPFFFVLLNLNSVTCDVNYAPWV